MTKTLFSSRKTNAIIFIMVAVFAIFAFAGCEQARNDLTSSSVTSSSLESSTTTQSAEESQAIAESSIVSATGSEVSQETEVSSEPESSVEEVSLTEDEVQAIIDSLPEITDEEFLSPSFTENSVKCYARAKENGEYGSYDKGDLFRIVGKYRTNYLVYYTDLPDIFLIKNEFIEILPLDYVVKDSDTIYNDG